LAFAWAGIEITEHSRPPGSSTGAHDPLARLDEDELRASAHDAFMAFWRGAEIEQPALWAAYCLAQARYEAYLLQAK